MWVKSEAKISTESVLWIFNLTIVSEKQKNAFFFIETKLIFCVILDLFIVEINHKVILKWCQIIKAESEREDEIHLLEPE